MVAHPWMASLWRLHRFCSRSKDVEVVQSKLCYVAFGVAGIDADVDARHVD